MVNIFIVDDDHRFLNSIKELLESFSKLRVIGQESSESSAVDWLLEHREDWHLTIVDLALGDGNGLRVLSACRVRLPTQKVIVLSNHLNASMKRRCMTLGADVALTKNDGIELIVKYCKNTFGA